MGMYAIASAASPQHTESDQFGAERIQIRCFGVDGDRSTSIGAAHESLHEGLQGLSRLNQFRPEVRHGVRSITPIG